MTKKKIIFTVSGIVLVVLFCIYFRSMVFNTYTFGADYFKSKGDYQKAETLLKQNLYIMDKLSSGGNERELLYFSINNMINFYNEQRLYSESEKIYKKYLTKKLANQIQSVFFNDKELRLAESYSDIGTIELRQGKYKESENYYKKALKLHKNIDKASFVKKGLDKKLDNLTFIDAGSIIVLNELGFLKIQEKKYQEAKEYLNEALKFEQKEKYFDSWETYYNLSILYRELGDYETAQKYAEKLLINSPPKSEIFPVPKTKENQFYFVLLSSKYNSLFKKNLAEIYIKQKKYNDAEDLLRMALNIDEEAYGNKSPEVLCDNYKLLNVYKKTKNKKWQDYQLKQINILKQNILSTKKYSGNELIYQLENICKQ